MDKKVIKQYIVDIWVAVCAGLIVSLAYYFFQNENGFAPGGVGGLATMTYHLLDNPNIEWAYLMMAFNIPIFVLVTIFVDKKLHFLFKRGCAVAVLPFAASPERS